MAKEWYILHTFSGREARVERAVRMLVEHARIPTNVIFDIKIPEELLTEVKDGKKRVVRRKFFPGYLLVEMDLPEVDWRIVCNEVRRIPGVSGFLGSSGNAKPQAVSADEARRILQKAGEIKGDRTPRIAQTFLVGQQVRIVEGPFATFSGEVEEVMSKRNKVRVAVTIFGRATPVELELVQVEAL